MPPALKKIFISYSKHDNHHKENLIKQLSGLRDSVITWNDRDIQAGEEWDVRIKEELHKADVVLYLVSANSMATDYIQKDELPLIEARCQRGECLLVPVIVDFCLWQKLDFAKYNALPEKGIPVTDSEYWTTESKAWLRVIEGIERIIRFELVTPPPQAYLKNYADDVVIHAAEQDLNFAATFRIELQKHLAAKLGGFKFRLRLQTNADDFSQAATVIILWSKNYLQQFSNIAATAAQEHLLLVEIDGTAKPESLEAVMPYLFWQQLMEEIVIYDATDRSYQLLTGKLATELNDLLQRIKAQDDFAQEIKNRQDIEKLNEITVFINVAPEDRELGEKIQQQLEEKYRLGSVLPSTTAKTVIRPDEIDNRYHHCQAVLFIYLQGSQDWIDMQLLTCNQALSEHKENFKIVAIYKDQHNPINACLPRLNLKKYFRPPELNDYLAEFVEALK